MPQVDNRTVVTICNASNADATRIFEVLRDFLAKEFQNFNPRLEIGDSDQKAVAIQVTIKYNGELALLLGTEIRKAQILGPTDKLTVRTETRTVYQD